jgi:hypothetical protein
MCATSAENRLFENYAELLVSAEISRFLVGGVQRAGVLPAAVSENDTIRVATLLEGCHDLILPMGYGKNQRHKHNTTPALSPICPQSALSQQKRTHGQSPQVLLYQ